MSPVLALLAWALLIVGCQTPTQHRVAADKTADSLIQNAQSQKLKQNEALTIETPADTLRRRLLTDQKLANSGPESFGTDRLSKPDHWPEADYPKRAASTGNSVPPWDASKPLKISLIQALQIGARNSRTYQTQKEDVFVSALSLDRQLDVFRNTYFGAIEGLLSTDGLTDTSGAQTTSGIEWQRRLESGAALSARLIFDTAKLLASDGGSSAGLFFDGSITIPLLRGAGRHIVYEPVTQAERDLNYSLMNFERFKRTVAVNIADEYLRVLQVQDGVINAQNNYERRVSSLKQTEALAEAGRLSEIQVDQARQAKLSSRESLIRSDQSYFRQLDAFKISLGLPADANLVLDRDELNSLADSAREALEKTQQESQEPEKAADLVDYLRAQPGGRYEIPEAQAVRLALDNRLDLQVAKGRVLDAQRTVVVAADALKAGLDVVANGNFGQRRLIESAELPSATLRPEQGFYSLGANLDLPWERTSERYNYRESYIALESATRNVQALEDQIKLNIRNGLRTLLEARESYKIQAEALKLAQKRVKQSQAFLEAGRPGVSIRDVLEAEDDLLEAQNALSAALVGYRVSELRVQRDMGLLKVNEKGLWSEYETQPK